MRTYADLLKLIEATPPLPRPEVIEQSPPLANFVEEEGDGDESVSYLPIPMQQVIKRIFERTGNWPRRAGANLFVHDETGVHWIDGAPALFGWLGSRCGLIEWRKQVGCVTKEEVYYELCRTAQHYLAVETLPHFPPMPDHYYACKRYETGDGESISKLVGYFSPETPADRDLILAMFVTPFWGGKSGSRPAFLITSDAGRGVGKSKITDMLSCLLGGHLELSSNEDAGRMRSRLLSPDGLKARLARLDNVKTLRFSWAELESVITSPLISGHRLHKGEACRPNTLTWIITLNGASLSTDMAQRVIIVKLTKPQRIGAWESDVVSFIESNRDAIISDIKAFLEIEPFPVPDHSRWAAWEDDIVGRLHDPQLVQQTIKSRSEISDVEHEEVEIIEEFFQSQITKLGYREDSAIFLPSKIVAEWFGEATKEKRPVVTACRIVNQFCTEGAMKKLFPHRKTKHRGFVFFGEKYESEEIIYDIEKRIEEKNNENQERKYKKLF